MDVSLKDFLDHWVARFNTPGFIVDDPIGIPHRFDKKQDIEIMGFFASILAWGQRKTIINKCNELIERMDHSPFEFITGHSDEDLKALLGFKHRTFNDTDLLYFVRFFKQHYSQYASLEDAFLLGLGGKSPQIHDPHALEAGLNGFKAYFFSLDDYPHRTRKHISSPAQRSSCKRLNMFLRWMVRKDDAGVDFGIWDRIRPSALICPCDVHVQRVARKLGLIEEEKSAWKTALNLTEKLRQLDPKDPVKYDFALFGLGVSGEI